MRAEFRVTRCIKPDLSRTAEGGIPKASDAGRRLCGGDGCGLLVTATVQPNGDSVTFGARCENAGGGNNCSGAVYSAVGELLTRARASGLLK